MQMRRSSRNSAIDAKTSVRAEVDMLIEARFVMILSKRDDCDDWRECTTLEFLSENQQQIRRIFPSSRVHSSIFEFDEFSRSLSEIAIIVFRFRYCGGKMILLPFHTFAVAVGYLFGYMRAVVEHAVCKCSTRGHLRVWFQFVGRKARQNQQQKNATYVGNSS